MRFQSKYSIRLYEFIKSIHYNELASFEKIITLDELRERLGAESYTEWKNIKARVLEPAIKEVNELSDKTVEYDTVTQNRAVTKLILRITTKNWEDANRGQGII